MKAPPKASSDRVSAFLLIAVAIPIFGLVLRLILETPPPGRELPRAKTVHR